MEGARRGEGRVGATSLALQEQRAANGSTGWGHWHGGRSPRFASASRRYEGTSFVCPSPCSASALRKAASASCTAAMGAGKGPCGCCWLLWCCDFGVSVQGMGWGALLAAVVAVVCASTSCLAAVPPTADRPIINPTMVVAGLRAARALADAGDTAGALVALEGLAGRHDLEEWTALPAVAVAVCVPTYQSLGTIVPPTHTHTHTHAHTQYPLALTHQRHADRPVARVSHPQPRRFHDLALLNAQLGR